MPNSNDGGWIGRGNGWRLEEPKHRCMMVCSLLSNIPESSLTVVLEQSCRNLDFKHSPTCKQEHASSKYQLLSRVWAPQRPSSPAVSRLVFEPADRDRGPILSQETTGANSCQRTLRRMLHRKVGVVVMSSSASKCL